MSETRELAAILAANVVGYSPRSASLARFRPLRTDVIDPAIAARRGRITMGAGSIIELRSLIDGMARPT